MADVAADGACMDIAGQARLESDRAVLEHTDQLWIFDRAGPVSDPGPPSFSMATQTLSGPRRLAGMHGHVEWRPGPNMRLKVLDEKRRGPSFFVPGEVDANERIRAAEDGLQLRHRRFRTSAPVENSDQRDARAARLRRRPRRRRRRQSRRPWRARVGRHVTRAESQLDVADSLGRCVLDGLPPCRWQTSAFT